MSSGSMSDARAAWREGVAVVLAFACLSIVVTYPLVLRLGRALPGDLGDPLFTTWLLGWDADRIRHGLHGFWNAPILFPSRGATAFSEHMLGIAIFVAPVIWLTGNPVLAYDLAFLMTAVLAGAGMYLLARELTGRRDAAMLAGLAFAFPPLRALHVSHLQVLAWGWMPIALWGLHRFFAARTASDTRAARFALAVFASAFVLQAFSNGYFIYFLAIAAGFVLLYELTSRPATRAERAGAIGAVAVASAFVLVAIAAVAVAYVSVRQQYGFRRPYDDWTMFSADVRSYLSAPSTLRLWGGWLTGDTAAERQLFPGVVALMACVAALWPGGRRTRGSMIYAALGATAFVLSLGPEPSAWSHRMLPSGPYLWFVRLVPGMDGLRVPARLSVVVLLAVSVLTAFGLARILERVPPRWRTTFAVLVGAAIVAEGWAVPLRLAAFDARGRAGDREAYRWLARQPPGGAIELPILEWSIAPTLTYQYASLSHGHPIVNGYSGYGSPLQEFLGGVASPLRDLDRMEDALELLRAVGVRYVLVHPRDFDDPALGEETAAAIRARPGLATEQVRSADAIAFRLNDAAPVADAAPAPGRRLGLADFHADASDAADRVPMLFDGDGDTRWLTGRPQAGDEWIRIRFDRPRDVSRIELQTASRSFGDYPRELTIDSAGDEGGSATLFRSPMLIPFGRVLATGNPQPALVVSLPPNRTRTLTIRQTGRTRRWFWSVHELELFER
ncbi:MAG: hypothetical protein ACHQO8_07755 [Vicinamibacterales bacterium]